MTNQNFTRPLQNEELRSFELAVVTAITKVETTLKTGIYYFFHACDFTISLGKTQGTKHPVAADKLRTALIWLWTNLILFANWAKEHYTIEGSYTELMINDIETVKTAIVKFAKLWWKGVQAMWSDAGDTIVNRLGLNQDNK